MKNKLIKSLVIIISVIAAIIVGFIIYDKVTANNQYSIGEKNLKIPIFLYHEIVNDTSEVEFDYMQTTKEVFENQILGLQKSDYKFISYEDLKKYSEGQIKLNKKSCILTFDDGCQSIYDNVYPFAKENNIPFTMYIITDEIGKDGRITWDEAKEMQDSGLVTIASHSKNHPEFTSLSTEEAVENVNESYKIIEENLGPQSTKIFTYPYGLNTEDQRKALKELGYVQNLTDNKINKTKDLDLSGLHRCYPLSDSVFKIKLKILYRSIRYN